MSTYICTSALLPSACHWRAVLLAVLVFSVCWAWRVAGSLAVRAWGHLLAPSPSPAFPLACDLLCLCGTFAGLMVGPATLVSIGGPTLGHRCRGTPRGGGTSGQGRWCRAGQADRDSAGLIGAAGGDHRPQLPGVAVQVSPTVLAWSGSLSFTEQYGSWHFALRSRTHILKAEREGRAGDGMMTWALTLLPDSICGEGPGQSGLLSFSFLPPFLGLPGVLRGPGSVWTVYEDPQYMFLPEWRAGVWGDFPSPSGVLS